MKKVLNILLLELSLIAIAWTVGFISGSHYAEWKKFFASWWWLILWLIVAPLIIRLILLKGKTKLYTQEEYDAKEQFDFDFDKKIKQNETTINDADGVK